MPNSIFKYDSEITPQMVKVMLDGREISLPAEMSVAAGLLGQGEIISRISPSSKRACSPHCLMGVCYECIMEINGINRQACMTKVEEGMVINRHIDGSDFNGKYESTEKTEANVNYEMPKPLKEGEPS
ncbi:(2Fe-2S)-binding protein [Desulfamplus magnetovallimortis]|nr:(2Fe-2S)-binding protein [Desulfamplus magnetovallimortis]